MPDPRYVNVKIALTLLVRRIGFTFLQHRAG
jgi:hypothetical protein